MLSKTLEVTEEYYEHGWTWKIILGFSLSILGSIVNSTGIFYYHQPLE